MKNQKLASLFAQGAISGRGFNMFIEGDTIYSYGYHFPIANKGYYLFTTRKYGSTTAKHMCYVKTSLPASKIINISNCNSSSGDAQIEADKYYISHLWILYQRARKKKEVYAKDIMETYNNIQKIEEILLNKKRQKTKKFEDIIKQIKEDILEDAI